VKDVMEIAHRSYAGVYPENTVLAAEKASNGDEHDQPDMIEIDVQPCKGEGIAVFHDEKLGKRGELGLTGKEGVTWKKECEEVFDAEVLDSGEKIPRLEEFLKAVPEEVSVNIELKDVDSEEVEFRWEEGDLLLGEKLDSETLERNRLIWKPFVEKVLEVAERFENEILISSFFEGAIAATSEVDPGIDTAFLFWNSIEEGLEVVEKYDCEALHPPVDMISRSAYFNQKTYTQGGFNDRDLVEWAHSRGKKVNVWTIENWHQAREMKEADVDGLITNYPLDIFYSK
jgi:glycerophosphoryl diester phosphodiesterase